MLFLFNEVCIISTHRFIHNQESLFCIASLLKQRKEASFGLPRMQPGSYDHNTGLSGISLFENIARENIHGLNTIVAPLPLATVEVECALDPRSRLEQHSRIGSVERLAPLFRYKSCVLISPRWSVSLLFLCICLLYTSDAADE